MVAALRLAADLVSPSRRKLCAPCAHVFRRYIRVFSGDLEGHAPSWPSNLGRPVGPRSVVAVFSVPTDATAAPPSTYGETCARFARMYSFDLEGHALSWPCSQCQRTRPQRVPPLCPFCCGPRLLWGLSGCPRASIFAAALGAGFLVMCCRKSRQTWQTRARRHSLHNRLGRNNRQTRPSHLSLEKLPRRNGTQGFPETGKPVVRPSRARVFWRGVTFGRVAP